MEESSGTRVPRWIYRRRGLLAAAPLVYALFSSTGEVEHHWLVWPAAVLLVSLGVSIRIWAQQHIRFRLAEHRHLSTTGPYRIMRNPLYVGNTLICVGLTVASELVWLAPITLLWCAVLYSLVVRYEEERVLQKYGEPFREYVARVPRWIPRALSFRGLELVTPYLRPALAVELLCLLTLVPYILKEFAEPWMR